ncbi:hypothetical protein BKA56DRAFT_47472 [Ilyonectria sp. MPI-CAGE-AT-0026]|nr:hypothetical protein BKA56DRAFT_47472 [Ilyonectria sp. MPI-CAGE-AT-0026]
MKLRLNGIRPWLIILLGPQTGNASHPNPDNTLGASVPNPWAQKKNFPISSAPEIWNHSPGVARERLRWICWGGTHTENLGNQHRVYVAAWSRCRAGGTGGRALGQGEQILG